MSKGSDGIGGTQRQEGFSDWTRRALRDRPACERGLVLVAMGMGERCSWKGKLAHSAGMFTGDVMTCVCYVTIIMIVYGANMFHGESCDLLIVQPPFFVKGRDHQDKHFPKGELQSSGVSSFHI